MKVSKTLIAAAVAAMIAGTAAANDNDTYGDKDKMKAGATFDALDANRDGRISRTEASADTTITFSTADTNGDGYLDSGEFKKAMKSGKHEDSSMPSPQPQSGPTPDSSGQPEPTMPPDQSTPPPSDTETPRQ